MEPDPRPPTAVRLAAVVLAALLAAVPPARAAERLLHGRVLTIGSQGELESAANTDVALVQTGRTCTTDSLGAFLLGLTEAQVAGRQVQLQVRKDGWVIHHPLEGRVDIPDDLAGRVVELHLLPKGSKRLWTDERIETLIADLAARAAEANRNRPAEPGVAPPPPNLAALIADWAGRYGFGPAEVQAQIDRWAAETEAGADDPYRLGLAAYARKNFTEAASRGLESGDAYAARLRAARERERDLLEKTLRGYRLAGDAASAADRFDEALTAYGKGLAAVHREESPRDWAEMTVLVGIAYWELGTRTSGVESGRHLAQSVAAQPADFEVGWTFAGTAHYIETEPTFEHSRAPLLGLIEAAPKGRDALVAAIDKASAELAGHTKRRARLDRTGSDTHDMPIRLPQENTMDWRSDG